MRYLRFLIFFALISALYLHSQDVVVMSGTYVSAGSGVVVKMGSLTVNSGATVEIGSGAKFQLFSDLTNSGTINCDVNSDFEFIGGFQVITGSVNFGNLTKSGGGSIILNSPISVSGVLSLQSGKIYLGGNDLTVLGSIGTYSSVNSIVQNGTGRLIRSVSGTGDFVFPLSVPVGSSEYYRGVKITFTTAPSSPGNLSVYFNASNPGTNGLPLNDGAIQIVSAWSGGYWVVEPSGGLSGGIYDIEVEAHGFSGTSDPTRLRVLKRASGGAWVLQGTHVAGGGTPSEVIVRRSGLSGFSEFGIGGTPFDFISAQLLVGFTVSDIYVETGATGNIAYIRLDWNDGNLGKTHGVWSWSFDVTSSVVSITDVTLAPSISTGFSINKTSIPNGKRVEIYGNTPSVILKDQGNSPGQYIVARVHFNSPSSDGDYPNAINLTNNTVSNPVIRDASLLNPSSMPAGDGIVSLNVHSSSLFIEQPPTFLPSGYSDRRKYGDINWDGSIDIADVTGLADVVIENWSAVTVKDPNGDRPFYEGDGYNGTDADNADRTASDVETGNGVIDQMDLATLQDAVINATWPSYAITAIAGKPAFKFYSDDDTVKGFATLKKINDGILHVDFEIFNPGDKGSIIRVRLSNSVEVKGVQISLKVKALPNFERLKFDVTPLLTVSGFKVAFGKNELGYLVILIYSDVGKLIKRGDKQGIVTISIPGMDVEKLWALQPDVKLSVGNLSYSASIDVRGASYIEIPKSYMLYQNYPNPFNPGTKIEFDVPEFSNVKLIIWNSLGQKVRELVNGQVDPARHVVYWDGKDESGVPVSSGIYFVTMYARSIEEQGKEFTMTRKMILLK
jgi:hypothetical protein